MSEKHALPTKYGTMFATFTEANHVCVCTGEEGTHFVVNGIAWRLLVHLYKWSDGRFHIGEEGKNSYEHRMSLHGTRESWTGKYSDAAITQSAREKVAPVVENHINTFATSRPHVIEDAELQHLRENIEREQANYDEAVKTANEAKAKLNAAKKAFAKFDRVPA
jgi:hypothetical protein